MKIQMQGQTLRVRISEAELARLLAGEDVENLTRLPAGMVCRQRVHLLEAAAPTLQPVADGWRFGLPRTWLEPYVARLPCRDGLLAALPIEAGGALQVHFEVDVRDSVRSRGAPRRGTQSSGEPDRAPG